MRAMMAGAIGAGSVADFAVPACGAVGEVGVVAAADGGAGFLIAGDFVEKDAMRAFGVFAGLRAIRSPIALLACGAMPVCDGI